jgi:zinc transporter, ZIP family
MVTNSENVGAAFGLVFAAGLSTAIGAAVVFVPRFVTLANRSVLAGSLGFSAGVMLYISFVDIMLKSIDAFHQAGHSYDDSYIYAALCFFSGVVILLVSICCAVARKEAMTLRFSCS